MNGPVGVTIGAGKGVIRTMLCDGKLKAQVIPVDVAINGLIQIGYHIGSKIDRPRPQEIQVFCLNAMDETRKLTWKEIMDKGKAIAYKYPLEAGLWYPNGTITTNQFVHKINLFFFQWVPAYLIDFLMLCFGQKRL